MSQFQEVLSIYKIESWCETAITVPIWENEDLCFGKKYALTSRLGEKGSRFRCRIDVYNRVFDL